MLPHSVRVSLLVVETVVSFALPTYFLLWGLITLPLWLAQAQRGMSSGYWSVFSVSAGLTGLVALVSLLSYVSSAPTDLQPMRGLWLFALLSALGLAAIWAIPTSNFTAFHFDTDLFSILLSWAPTFCTLHLLTLALMRDNLARANH